MQRTGRHRGSGSKSQCSLEFPSGETTAEWALTAPSSSFLSDCSLFGLALYLIVLRAPSVLPSLQSIHLLLESHIRDTGRSPSSVPATQTSTCCRGRRTSRLYSRASVLRVRQPSIDRLSWCCYIFKVLATPLSLRPTAAQIRRSLLYPTMGIARTSQKMAIFTLH